MVRANIKGVFPTYRTLKDGTRRTYRFSSRTRRAIFPSAECGRYGHPI